MHRGFCNTAVFCYKFSLGILVAASKQRHTHDEIKSLLAATHVDF